MMRDRDYDQEQPREGNERSRVNWQLQRMEMGNWRGNWDSENSRKMKKKKNGKEEEKWNRGRQRDCFLAQQGLLKEWIDRRLEAFRRLNQREETQKKRNQRQAMNRLEITGRVDLTMDRH